MRITIIGGGKVGASLARMLCREKHEITIIEQDESVVEKLSGSMDVICYIGNGASFAVLQAVQIENCDLLIAVTGSDELNLLACLCAHKLGAKHTIARVRNPEYDQQLYALKQDFGLSMSINPEKATAEEIARVLRFPSASHVELFASGRVELVCCRLPENNRLVGERLRDLPLKFGINVLICAVDRAGELTIPDGNFMLADGDELYLTGTPKHIAQAFRRTGLLQHPVRSVMIAGGGKISYYLAQALSKQGQDVKIVEVDPEVAAQLATQLNDVVILQGDASDHAVLLEEGMRKTDAFVALTGIDEANILSALYATQNQVPKVISKVNDEHLSALTKLLGVEALVSPKAVTANQIVRYVRALAASADSDSICSLHKILDGRAEVVEFEAEREIRNLTNIPLSKLRLKRNLLIASLVRDSEVITPSGNDSILPGDIVLVVTAEHPLSRLSDILDV